jgi:flagellar biosynthesis/type III secretory pathway protein FliH
MDSFNPADMGSSQNSKVGLKGILRDGNNIQSALGAAHGGDGFQSALFPVMESLTAVTKREEENRKVSELEAEILRLQREKKNDERRFQEEIALLRAEVSRQSHKEGFSAGRAEAEAEAQRQLEQMRQEFSEQIENIWATVEAFAQDTEVAVGQLLGAALRRIAGHWLDQNPSLIEVAARECLSWVGASEKIQLLVHPDDVEFVQSAASAWLPKSAGRVQIEVVGDARVSLRSCIMETPAGRVEYLMPAILERLYGVIDQAFVTPNPNPEPAPEHQDLDSSEV